MSLFALPLSYASSPAVRRKSLGYIDEEDDEIARANEEAVTKGQSFFEAMMGVTIEGVLKGGIGKVVKRRFADVVQTMVDEGVLDQTEA